MPTKRIPVGLHLHRAFPGIPNPQPTKSATGLQWNLEVWQFRLRIIVHREGDLGVSLWLAGASTTYFDRLVEGEEGLIEALAEARQTMLGVCAALTQACGVEKPCKPKPVKKNAPKLTTTEDLMVTEYLLDNLLGPMD